MEANKQLSTLGYIRSWILFPFNLWLWTVTIPLRIFLYITFGDFWKWSSNGRLPNIPEVKITNGKILSQSTSRLRSYPVGNKSSEPAKRFNVGRRSTTEQVERYPTYISTEIFADQPAPQPQPQQQEQFEKAPTFFNFEKIDVEIESKREVKAEDRRLSSFIVIDEETPFKETTAQRSSDIEFDNTQVHGFFNVPNQVNDRKESTKIPVNKRKSVTPKKTVSPKKQETQREDNQAKESRLSEQVSKSTSPMKPVITEEQLLEKEKTIQSLNQQIAELEEREKKAIQEKLDIESKFENESTHWKEDNESVTKEKAQLRETLDQRNKETFDLKQKITELKNQLHAHGDHKLDEHKEIKSVWNVAHHENDYTKMVEQQQYEQTHTKTFAEVLEDGSIEQSNQVNSIGAN